MHHYTGLLNPFNINNLLYSIADALFLVFLFLAQGIFSRTDLFSEASSYFILEVAWTQEFDSTMARFR